MRSFFIILTIIHYIRVPISIENKNLITRNLSIMFVFLHEKNTGKAIVVQRTEGNTLIVKSNKKVITTFALATCCSHSSRASICSGRHSLSISYRRTDNIALDPPILVSSLCSVSLLQRAKHDARRRRGAANIPYRAGRPQPRGPRRQENADQGT